MSGRYYSEEQVTNWLAASCERQGVPVAVSDRDTLARVAVLLGAAARQGKGRKRHVA